MLFSLHPALTKYWASFVLSKALWAVKIPVIMTAVSAPAVLVEIKLFFSLCFMLDQAAEEAGAVCQRGSDVAEDCPSLLGASGQR